MISIERILQNGSFVKLVSHIQVSTSCLRGILVLDKRIIPRRFSTKELPAVNQMQISTRKLLELSFLHVIIARLLRTCRQLHVGLICDNNLICSIIN